RSSWLGSAALWIFAVSAGPRLLCTANRSISSMHDVLHMSIHAGDNMVTKSKVPLALRIDPVLKEAAERAAADDRRSLTSLIESLLDQHLKAHGYLPTGTEKQLVAGKKGKRR